MGRDPDCNTGGFPPGWSQPRSSPTPVLNCGCAPDASLTVIVGNRHKARCALRYKRTARACSIGTDGVDAYQVRSALFYTGARPGSVRPYRPSPATLFAAPAWRRLTEHPYVE